MIKFSGNIVQFGFGAVGKSFYEKVKNEINFDENNYYVISNNNFEFEAFINMGGISTNFINTLIDEYNYASIFKEYLKEGDILIDFADSVGTLDFCKWCIDNKVMYLNTGETDWPSNWYCIFEENLKKNKLKKEVKDKIKYPILLQHGNNPGLVSHFVKEALVYVVNTQYKKNKEYKKLIKENKFNELAMKLNVKMIHVNDIDLQRINEDFNESKLVSTWCIDSFFFELLSEATQNVGTHEYEIDKKLCKKLDFEKGFLEYKKYAVDKKIKTVYPGGYFEGYLVPHEETITIANSLEVYDENKVIYRPSVMFVYLPCHLAEEYLEKSRTNIEDEEIAVRGHLYPEKSEVVYKEKITEGTEYVGILLMGDNFKPVWVGNRVEMNYLYKQKNSYWQTPTITPVSMSALAGLCWMIKNKDKGDIYFPDDIKDYKNILKIAEKYISKTIYHTFDKDIVYKNMDLKTLVSSDFYAKEKE